VFRTDEFKISRPMYAVDLSSFVKDDPGPSGNARCEVRAVWFRRRKRVTAACAGRLRGYAPAPVDALDFLAKFTDGRYGGDCAARWDGTTLWCLDDEETRAAHLDLLQPMLALYPRTPAGYSGWWHFG
jgi:hypothetical protein